MTAWISTVHTVISFMLIFKTMNTSNPHILAQLILLCFN